MHLLTCAVYGLIQKLHFWPQEVNMIKEGWIHTSCKIKEKVISFVASQLVTLIARYKSLLFLVRRNDKYRIKFIHNYEILDLNSSEDVRSNNNDIVIWDIKRSDMQAQFTFLHFSIFRFCLRVWRREEGKGLDGGKYGDKMKNLSHFLKN